jgi:hypothetical protein
MRYPGRRVTRRRTSCLRTWLVAAKRSRSAPARRVSLRPSPGPLAGPSACRFIVMRLWVTRAKNCPTSKCAIRGWTARADAASIVFARTISTTRFTRTHAARRSQRCPVSTKTASRQSTTTARRARFRILSSTCPRACRALRICQAETFSSRSDSGTTRHSSDRHSSRPRPLSTSWATTAICGTAAARRNLATRHSAPSRWRSPIASRTISA